MNTLQTLDHTDRLQDATQGAIARMQQQANESQDVALTTLETLETQRETLTHMNQQTNRLHTALDHTARLQDKLSRWTLTFNRRKARRQAKKEIKQQKRQDAVLRTNQKTSDHDLPKRLEQAMDRKQLRDAWQELETLTITTESDSDEREEDAQPAEPSWMPAKRTTRIEVNSDDNVERRLQRIHQQDAAIDTALDSLAAQIQDLMGLAVAQGEEMRTQATALDSVEQSLESAAVKQATVNHRARGFMTGRFP